MTAPSSGGRLTEVDRLVHEPARLMILAHLYVVDEADFTFLQAHTGLTGGNLSFHLTKLEEAGYVSVHKEFRERTPCTVLALTPAGRSAFEGYRNQMTRFLQAGVPDPPP